MTTAYSYIRFSTRRQADGDSIRRQTELAANYCKVHNLKLDEKLTLQDLGVSAFTKANLEVGELAAFIKAVKLGKVEKGSFLLVEQFDRFSRAEPLVAFSQLEQLIRAGIVVVTLFDGRVYDSVSTKELAPLFIAIASMSRAHEESLHKSKRLKSAWEGKRQRREKVLTRECPRWLKSKEDRTGFDLIPEKVESIKKVFNLTIAGYGNVAITRKANLEGWAHPGNGGQWQQTLVTKLVANRAVLGEYQPYVNVEGKRQPLGEPWLDHYPRIITNEIFQLATAIKSRRAKIPRRRDALYRNLFQGILFCKCGASFVRKNKSSDKQKGYALYMCSARQNGATKCTSMSVYELESNLLLSIYMNAFSYIRTEAEIEAMTAKLTALKYAKVVKSESVERLVNAIANTDSANLVTKLVEVESEIRSMLVEIDSIEVELQKLNVSAESKFSLGPSTFASDYHRVLDESEISFRAELREKILSVVDKIVVYPEQDAAALFFNHVDQVFIKSLGGPPEMYRPEDDERIIKHAQTLAIPTRRDRQIQ